jgi:hypothetical protein
MGVTHTSDVVARVLNALNEKLSNEFLPERGEPRRLGHRYACRKPGAQMQYQIAYLIVALIAALIGLAIAYALIRSAVRAALFEHYKVVRWYELTGQWRTEPMHWKNAPRDIALNETFKE